ncbi:uncharacterized protein LOC144922075 isoform X1 [Branchiostoma floridae x Branchiostoma belcheri]
MRNRVALSVAVLLASVVITGAIRGLPACRSTEECVPGMRCKYHSTCGYSFCMDTDWCEYDYQCSGCMRCMCNQCVQPTPCRSDRDCDKPDQCVFHMEGGYYCDRLKDLNTIGLEPAKPHEQPVGPVPVVRSAVSWLEQMFRPPPCLSTDDCQTGQKCVYHSDYKFSFCRGPLYCQRDSDCGRGRLCLYHDCRKPPPCYGDNYCTPPLRCLYHQDAGYYCDVSISGNS